MIEDVEVVRRRLDNANQSGQFGQGLRQQLESRQQAQMAPGAGDRNDAHELIADALVGDARQQ